MIGRKGRDYFQRRKAPLYHVFSGVWEKLDHRNGAQRRAHRARPFLTGEVDAIYLVYNEFKSAMSQRVVAEPLFPLQRRRDAPATPRASRPSGQKHREFLFEPDKKALLERLVPMYVEVSIAARAARVDGLASSARA